MAAMMAQESAAAIGRNTHARPRAIALATTQQWAMQQTLQIDGIDIHIDSDSDSAQSVVMLHGWPDTWRLWDAQVAHLKAQYRCIRFTQPGFDVHAPRRAWPLEELLDFYGRVIAQTCPGRKVVLMLHDWGCMFGYQFAMRHPELVAKVVAIDIGDVGSRTHRSELGAKGKLGVLAYQGFLALAWRISGWGAVKLGDRMTRWMARKLGCKADPALIGACMNYPYDITWTGSHGSYRAVKRVALSCPLFFAYGQRKPFMFHSRAWLDQIAAQPGNAVQGYDTGHWVMLRAAQPLNEAVSAWLAR